MSLEHFKTQVLLLHSEQSTLDSLSNGFSDRYTVHCATSGSEALNTLGDTPIHVIVTAQNLPGMSGLDALREAKKRSPDTIGILLAGSADDGLEALVGDKEVFQIVRGNVTPESLRDLIDSATRQERLLALAESANDTAANVDEPVSEHIVMETSENGSTIISDGTARMPVLNPDKVSAAANVGSQAVDVLVLTQDEEFLTTVKDSARGMHNVLYANTLAQADDAVNKHKVGVAVVDAAMLGSNVEKLTLHLRTIAPRLVAIVAGRRDDGEMLMDLINRGKVYRFLLKPVSPGRARLAIEASVKHHLEAPDAAFKSSNVEAPAPIAPVAKLKAKVAATPTPKPKSTPKPKPKPATKKPAQSKPQPVPKIVVEPRPVPTGSMTADAPAPIDDGFSDAFGSDDTSFTETVTGFVKSVGESFSSVKRKKSETEKKPPEPVPESTGGSLFENPQTLGMGAAALVLVAALGWWIFGGSDEAVPVVEPSADAPSITAADPVVEAQEPGANPTVAPDQAEVEVAVDPMLEEARRAAEAGQIFNPPGGNAIELYILAAATTPNSDVVAAELANVIEQALGMAETALLDRRADDASAALQRVALADPGNARLPFLNAQLAQMQLRDYLDEARLAIRETRFEEAALVLDDARALGIDDATEIDTVAAELDGAVTQQRVEEVLAQANARFEEGKLTSPSNDNARYYYEVALNTDPQSSAARQGLNAVASKLVLQARAQIDSGDFASADILLADARRLDPSSNELADTTAALGTARERLEQQRREATEKAAAEKAAAERAAAEKIAAEQAAAERAAAERAAAEKAAAERAAAEKVAAEKAALERAAAEKAAAERAAVEKAAAEKAAAEKAIAEQVAAERAAARKAAADKAAADKVAAERAAAAQAATERLAIERTPSVRAKATPEESTSDLDRSSSDAPTTFAVPPIMAAKKAVEVPANSVADSQVAKPQAGSVANNRIAKPQVGSGALAEPPIASKPVYSTPVAVSSLQRTKYVAPKYPRSAQRRSLSGYVDLVFTVDIDGTVKNVTISDSTPGDTFVSAATNAVEDWEFAPIIEDGIAVERRAAVRLMFALE